MSSNEPYLGVYHAIDPKIYDEIHPSDPSPRIKEIADLMTAWYNLFIEMRYINRDDVAFPPHKDPAINTAQAAKYGLTKNVVDLLQLLPYYSAFPNWNFGTDNGEFLVWGGFLEDLRQKNADWEHNLIDPFYASPNNDNGNGWNDPNGPYMRPWYAPLTDCGNHGSIMILDTENCGTSDPALRGRPGNDSKLANRNDLNQYPSRPAVEFLQDMMSRFRSLEWMPGALYRPQDKEHFKDMYMAAGWPHDFSPEVFDRLLQEKDNAEDAQRRSFMPIEELDRTLLMIRWKQETEWMIKAIDSKLNDGNPDPNIKRETLLDRKERCEKQMHTPKLWNENQAKTKADLKHSKAEFQLYRTRSGRFEGLAEGDYARLIEDQFLQQIRDLETLLADRDIDSRDNRMLLEALTEAASVSDETWAVFALKREDEYRQTTMDSWLELKEIRSIVRDKLDATAVRSLVLQAIERTKKVDFWAQ